MVGYSGMRLGDVMFLLRRNPELSLLLGIYFAWVALWKTGNVSKTIILMMLLYDGMV